MTMDATASGHLFALEALVRAHTRRLEAGAFPPFRRPFNTGHFTKMPRVHTGHVDADWI